MRLIDADALLKELELYSEYAAISIVKEAPTIDAEPVRHGKWVEDDEGGGNVCGLCRWYVYEGDRDNYCPHCGAKMDVEE